MMVVSNTSPLTNLAAIGQFNLLQALYREIRIAESVWQELHACGQAWPGGAEVDAASWVTHGTAQNGALVTALRQDLDAGEAESIALAVELKADLLLLDEKEGRHHAGRLNVRVMGTVGVLLQAKQNGLLPAVRPALDALRQTASFYLSQAVYAQVLKLTGE